MKIKTCIKNFSNNPLVGWLIVMVMFTLIAYLIGESGLLKGTINYDTDPNCAYGSKYCD